MNKFMIWMKGVAVLASLAGAGLLVFASAGMDAGEWNIPLLFLSLPLINLWAVLKAKPGKVLKTAAVLISLVVFVALWHDFCWPWVADHYLSKGRYFIKENFFSAVGLIPESVG